MTAAIPELEHVVQTDRANRRTNVAILVMVGITCLVIAASAILLFTKIDGKVSHIDTTVSKVRHVQVANTARSNCQDQGFNAILTDARLAFLGDKNPANYAKAKKCM